MSILQPRKNFPWILEVDLLWDMGFSTLQDNPIRRILKNNMEKGFNFCRPFLSSGCNRHSILQVYDPTQLTLHRDKRDKCIRRNEWLGCGFRSTFAKASKTSGITRAVVGSAFLCLGRASLSFLPGRRPFLHLTGGDSGSQPTETTQNRLTVMI